MHFAALIASSFAVATATRPPIIPFVDQAPTPQWGAIKPGVYRFVNYATGTALSVKDSSADSQVVSMPVANDDNAQRWHVLDPVGGLGLSIMNNGTGKFITGLQVGQPVRAKTALPDDWNAIWAIQHGEFGPAPTDPMR
ncbi:MAG: hypothetical protein L6R42_000113 [Xanthoria sp. 1 TBL-2021]|nr:MAG: hypothetical protein L6R42_000113 [Xanthoria sp. 1 TBL-2021]